MSLMSVLELAANSDAFYERAAQALVSFGMHTGHVLLIQNGRWEVRARNILGDLASDLAWTPSQRVLEQVKSTKRTVWTDSPTANYTQKSLTAVVAAPIRNRSGEVIGADRKSTRLNSSHRQ